MPVVPGIPKDEPQPVEPVRPDVATLGVAPPPVELPEGPVYDPILDAPPDVTMRSSLRDASRQISTPDQYAQALGISRRMRLPIQVVVSDFDKLKRQDEFERNTPSDLELKYPGLSKWLRGTDNAALVHDDMPATQALNDALKSAPKIDPYWQGVEERAKSVLAGGAGFFGSAIGGTGELVNIAGRGAAELASVVLGKQVSPELVRKTFALPDWANPATWLIASGKGWEEQAERLRPFVERRTIVTDVLEGLGQVAGQVATGGAGKAVQSLSLLAQGTAIGVKGAEGDVAPQGAKDVSAILSGLATAATEKIGLGLLLDRIPPNIKNKLFRWVADVGIGGAIEASQEVAEGILHASIRKVLTNKEVEILQGIGREAAVGGGVGAIIRAAVATAIGVKSRTPAERSQIHSEALTEMSKAIQETKLHGRSLEKLVEFVEIETEGGPNEFKYAPVETFTEYAAKKGLQPDAFAAQITGNATAYQDALASGQPLTIPTAKWASQIVGTEHEGFFKEELRSDPLEMNAREGKVFLQEQEAESKARQEKSEQVVKAIAGRQAELEGLALEETVKERRDTLVELKATDLIAQVQGTLPPGGRISWSSDADPTKNAEELIKSGVPKNLIGKPGGHSSPIDEVADRFGMSSSELVGALSDAANKRKEVKAKIANPQVSQAILEAIVDREFKLAMGDIKEELPPAKLEQMLVKSAQKVGQAVNRALSAIGLKKIPALEKIGAKDIESLSSVQAAVYKRLADLLEITPEELFEREKLRFERAEVVPEGAAFEQAQPLGLPPRGFTEILAEGTKIGFTKYANFSTLIHELFGHHWLDLVGRTNLDILGRIPTGTVTPKQYKFVEESQAILDFLGAKEGFENLTKKQHEKFAEAMETYFLKGQAPSETLRSAFYRFSQWLIGILKELTGRVEFSPEAKLFIDRLLATDAQIEAAKAELNQNQMTAQTLGLTGDQAVAYDLLMEKDLQAATEEVRKKAFLDISRQERGEWQEQEAKVRVNVTGSVNQEPVYIARSVLAEGKLPDGSPMPEAMQGITLNTNAIPEDRRAALTPYHKADGTADPATVAGMFGFPSGDALMGALENAEPRDKKINRLTREAMQATYGEPLSTSELKAEALKAVHNEKRADLLMMRVRELGKKSNLPVTPLKLLRDHAKNVVGRTKVGEINLRLIQRAQQDAAREAFEAAARGDFDAAFNATKREFLNHEIYAEAARAKDSFLKGQEYLESLGKKTTRERIGKNDPEGRAQIDGLLDRYGIRDLTPTEIERGKEPLQEWRDANSEYEPVIDGFILSESYRGSYLDLTVEQFTDLVNAAKSIAAVSRHKGQIKIGDRRVDLEEVVAAAVARAKQSVPKIKEKLKNFDKKWNDKLSSGLTLIDVELATMETLLEILDDGAIGPWHDAVFNPSSDAQGEFLDLLNEIQVEVNKITDAYVKDNKTRLGDMMKTPLGEMQRGSLISVAFNAGTDSSLDKMSRGHGWSVDRIQKAIEELSKADLNYIQSIWNVIGSLYPKITALHERVSGVPLEKLPLRPFTVNTAEGPVEMQGGYYPLVRDPDKSKVKLEQQVGSLSEILDEGYTAITTPSSHRKERTKVAYPLLLDFQYIVSRHLTGVVKDLTYREFLMDTKRFLEHPDIRRTLQERLGVEHEKRFIGSPKRPGWLRRIANEHVSAPGLGILDRIFEYARNKLTVVYLGFKASSILVQQVGHLQSAEYISKRYGVKFYLEAMKEFLKNPIANMDPNNPDGMRAQAEAASGEMRYRPRFIDRDLADATQRLESGKIGMIEKHISRLGMYGIKISDMVVSVPTFWAGYNGAIAKDPDLTHKQAVYAGEAAVRRSQGSGTAKDLSEIQARRGATRLFTMFYTPFAAIYGRLRNEGADVKRYGKKYAPEAIIRAAILTSMVAILSDLIAGRGPDDDDEEDRVKAWAKWAALKALFAPAAVIPLLRDVSNAMEHYVLTGKSLDVRYSPVFSALDKLGRTSHGLYGAVAGDKDFTDELAWDVIESGGTVVGLPIIQPVITGEYLLDLLEGEATPEGPGDFMHDLLFRRTQKERRGE